MPAPSTAIQEALAANVTWCTGDPIIKVTARDGVTVAAYAPHTRYLNVGGTLYTPYNPVDVSRPSLKIGLQPDAIEFKAPYDEVITKADVQAGRWRGGRAETAYVVDYRNPSLGLVQEREWFIGRTKPRATGFTFELLGRTQALHQQTGATTSPIDRNRTPEELGVNIASFTHAATVTAVTSRRVFTTGVVQADVNGVPYFRYGRCVWLTGANAGDEMEIEDNAAGVITLQLPMSSDIEIGDTLELIAGYDGSREQARDKFGKAENMDAETDLPGMRRVLTYPPS